MHTGTRSSGCPAAGGGYLLQAGPARLRAQQVVLATGPFQVPRVPVVGGGNSGFQIAAELAATQRVGMALGRRNATVPQRPLGRDVPETHRALQRVLTTPTEAA